MGLFAFLNRKEYLELTGQQDTINYKVAELAERTGGIYSLMKHQGLHKGSAKVRMF